MTNTLPLKMKSVLRIVDQKSILLIITKTIELSSQDFQIVVKLIEWILFHFKDKN